MTLYVRHFIAAVTLGLVAALWLAIERNQTLSADLAVTEADLARSHAQHEATRAELAEDRKARDRMAQRLREQEAQRDQLQASLRAERARRAQLEQENAEIRHWSDTDIPGPIRRLLIASPLYRDNHLPAVRHDSAPGHDRGAPREGAPNKEPGPVGPGG